MSRELLVVRHGKSDWSQPDLSDFDRPLKKKGIAAARKMGRFLYEQGLKPDTILASSAKRATETALLFAQQLCFPEAKIQFLPQLYLCELETLFTVLNAVSPAVQCPMVVGHNPGMDFLVRSLSRKTVSYRQDGKLMTTAAVAHFSLEGSVFQADAGRLESLWRPADI
ncbi:MAG: phosphohistidine phosphatase [Acidobacteria bacterium]|nr:MAG: phosphohistidine phosphatase [Acidobacteriota bacterium]